MAGKGKLIKQETRAGVFWLDARDQSARQGKSWLTLNRWMDNPKINYPRPERYTGKTPYTKLETIEKWEASQATTPPEHPNLRPREAASAEAS